MNNLGRQLVTLIFALSPGYANAAALNYQSLDLKYELDYEGGILRYKSANLTYTFQKRECTKKLVEEFWNEKIKFAGSLPQSASLKSTAQVQLNNKTYVIPILRKNTLSRVPKEVQVLIVKEAAKCSR